MNDKELQRRIMMLDNVTGINLKGANFEDETALQIFSETYCPSMGMIYGKNGAGKSTISRAYSKLTGKEEDSILYADLIDKEGNSIDIDESDKVKIHIFNEDYIDNNIRLEEDGLETIVVLGKRKDIEDQIKIAQELVDKKQVEINSQQAIYNEFLDVTTSKSPEYIEAEITNLLKGDDHWAGRDSKIKGNTRASSVKANTYQRFINVEPTKTRDVLVVEFSKKLDELKEARSGAKIIEKEAKLVGEFSFDEDKYISLLSKSIEKPILSEREKYLLSLSTSKGHEYIDSIKKFFSNKKTTRCPFCLQRVDDDYKEELFQSIETILSKEAEKHQKELGEIRLNQFEFDFEPFAELDAKLIESCKSSLEAMNDAILNVNENIKKKYDDVYSPIIAIKKDIQNIYEKLLDLFKKLEDARKEYNKSAVEVNSKIKELNILNAEITFYDIKEKYEEYKICKSAKEKAKVALEKLNAEMLPFKKELQDLVDEKKNAKIALQKINDGLRYIFFANDRLSIDYHDDKYFLLSRGKSVSPKKISVGERNAIALCYFFSEIMKNKDEEKIYDNEYFFIIDDPVSSFDMENRVGIMSYLKYQLQRFEVGNSKTKTLILTHDMQTAFDIEKLYGEVVVAAGGKKNDKFIKLYELTNNHLEKFVSRDKNEYSNLMSNIYLYACGENPNYELVVGNSMRRLLEAFATFTYKKGIEGISTNKNIIGGISEPYATYFENLMYRFVLHGGSHAEEKIKSLTDMNFFDCISSEEKERTAKEILCFIYLLNKVHIIEHLTGYGADNVKNNMEKWLQEIKERTI